MTALEKFWAGVIAAGIAFCAWSLWPTVRFLRMSPAERAEAFRRGENERALKLGLDLQGGLHIVLEVDTSRLTPGENPEEAVERAKEIIRNRIDQLGLREPLIARQGDRWIVVQLPGVSETDRARDLIGRTALLEFRLADESDASRRIADKVQELNLKAEEISSDGKPHPALAPLLPKGTVLMRRREGGYLLVKSSAELTGAFLESASMQIGGRYNEPYVAFKLTPEGGRIFGRLTEANVQKRLAIVLDGVVQSAPVIREPIRGGEGIIEGRFTAEEARELAIVLRSGALPAPVKIIEERMVGPTLGRDSIRAGITAALAGVALTLVFMAVYYSLCGLAADLALLLNTVLVLAGMASLGATLTLPGLAGILLSAAMAVDANVLIYERIREELAIGKSPHAALEAGFDKALPAIVDSNLTTLVAAAFLFQFGSGPIKGFAVTLTLGLAFNLFTATVVVRMILRHGLLARPGSRLAVG